MIIIKPNRKIEGVYKNQKKYINTLVNFFARNKSKIIEDVLMIYDRMQAAKARVDARLQELLAQLNLNVFEELIKDTEGNYKNTAEIILKTNLRVLRKYVSQEEFDRMFSLIDRWALQYAQEKSAGLVGKRWIGGRLVDAKKKGWRIDEATRELLKQDIAEAISEGWSTQTLRKVLAENYAFSRARADMIARTETNFVYTFAQKKSWQESGVVKFKVWLISEDPCELCMENAETGEMPIDTDFPNGDPPVHPNCTCDLAAVIKM